MPEFVSHQAIQKKTKKEDISEMDNDFHEKFKKPETETNI